MELDVDIHCHIYYWSNDTRRICASAKKNEEKQRMIRNLKEHKERTRRTIKNWWKCLSIDQFHFLFENEAGERYCFINILLCLEDLMIAHKHVFVLTCKHGLRMRIFRC